MAEPPPVAVHQHVPDRLDDSLQFLKRTRSELRALRKIRAFRDRLDIIDVNGDRLELRGLGYADADIVPVLDALNAVYRPQSVHEPPDADFKEFSTGRRYPWAHDRVM